ncbi:MAG TPA: AzlC family ABC transporter permease [Streptomyces sp.]|jgi:4-azaleucine resistance transporter AzlC|nr:AzlC family ABC transporter permease [Streptomyces sp.]
MRSLLRTTDRRLLRDVGLVCLADGVIGASFGAVTVAGGLPWWVPVVMSLAVFAGAAQFSAVGVAMAGGGPFAAVSTGLLLNTRTVPFSLAVADVLGSRRLTQLIGAHLITDETAAFALAQPDRATRRRAFWVSGIGLYLAWNACTLAGALLGQAIGDTDAFGLDAAFPAVLLALVMPALRDAATRNAALLGAAIAVLTTPFLPPGTPVLLALLGLFAARRAPRGGQGRPA